MLSGYISKIPIMIFERVLRIISQLLLTIVVARFYGAETFGLFSYIFSIVYLFNALANLGFDSVFVKFLVGAKSYRYIASGALIRFTSVLCFIPIFLCLVYFLGLWDDVILASILYAGLIPIAMNVFVYYFQSIGRADIPAISSSFSIVLFLGVKVYFVATGAELLTLAILMVIENLALFVVLCIVFCLKNQNISVRFYKKESLFIIRSVLPLVLSSAIVTLYMRMDQIMIGAMLDDYSVGIYAVGVRLVEGLYFLPVVIVTALYPYVARVIDKQDEINLIFQNLYSFLFLFSILICGFFWLVGEFLIESLFGQVYSSASEVLFVMSMNLIFVSMGVVYTRYLTLYDMGVKVLYRSLFALSVNLILNYFLIPIYGIVGAAYATLAAQCSANYFYDVFDKELRSTLYLKNRSFLLYFPRVKK